MTAATMPLVTPTRTELTLLRLIARMNELIESRIARRAERSVIDPDLLREQHLRAHALHEAELMRAWSVLPRP